MYVDLFNSTTYKMICTGLTNWRSCKRTAITTNMPVCYKMCNNELY